MSGLKSIKVAMFKNGEWIKWDGRDVSQVMIEEILTLGEIKKQDKNLYNKLLRQYPELKDTTK